MSFKFDTSKFERALKAFAAESRKSGREVLENQARLFVRDAATITPPNNTFRFTKGKGVARVRKDIAKVMRPARLSPNDPAVFHRRFRGSRGRINIDLRGLRDGRIPISKPRLDAFIRRKISHVGFLAAGWVAAARRLKTNLPEWITRHGARFGSVRITLNRRGIAVRIVNTVPYVGEVGGLRRRIQTALDFRAGAMERQLEDLAVKRAAKRAGFRT
jgi:hypothetical protein